MREKIIVTNAVLNEDTLLLETDTPISDLTVTGQMLVDSDQFAFIYVAEKNNEYTYIVLGESVWSAMKSALNNDLPVFIKKEEVALELTGFHEELSYLVENIKGNSNYGEEMVSKVEDTF
ncbi:hypothetical protein SM124_01250 [Bacillus sp. 31A1R]|uniref:UPF0738 protein SM124_01250 n=1 Tax=Robertmurraya mangrovi TaxID=3098077 RepID=A0ABU5IT76_9BACI|nr:hypothetical protein [Bacillus sp. 31A1R]MDZ5470364.1 hypothetical protein [Bacillus sp. 31A1R]